MFLWKEYRLELSYFTLGIYFVTEFCFWFTRHCIEFSSHVPVVDTPVNVIVTDLTCPKTVVRRSLKSGIPLVASEWVMQCLINGKRLSFTGHPRYSYDFNSWRIIRHSVSVDMEVTNKKLNSCGCVLTRTCRATYMIYTA